MSEPEIPEDTDPRDDTAWRWWRLLMRDAETSPLLQAMLRAGGPITRERFIIANWVPVPDE